MARMTGFASNVLTPGAMALLLAVLVSCPGSDDPPGPPGTPPPPPPPPPPITFQLSITASGSGSGRITAPSVAGVPAIDCAITSGAAGSGCGARYPTGSVVQLTAAPATGSEFSGWVTPVGSCTGATSFCSVTMAADATVSPGFALATGSLRIDVSGLPSPAAALGTVTSGSGFNATFNGPQVFPALVPGAYVVTPSPVTASDTTYTAAPQTGVVVAGQEVRVAISYAGPRTRVLTIAGGGAGTGSGRVTSTPAGIDCVITNGSTSGTCDFTFALDVSVALNVVAGTLTSWSDACTGSGACQVMMSQNRRVVASFATAAPVLVMKTTLPVIAADRNVTFLNEQYAIHNAGGGTLTPTVFPANPAPWLSVRIVDSSLWVDINAVGLRGFAEHLSPYQETVTISSPNAGQVPVRIKFAKSLDLNAGGAATRVRFHRNSLLPDDQLPASNTDARIDLLDARTNTPIIADTLVVDPPDQNWLETPRLNADGQLVLRVKRITNPPAKPTGTILGTPIRIKLIKKGSESLCPNFTTEPDPRCHIFVYYSSDPFPKMVLKPFGVQLTAARDTGSAEIAIMQTQAGYTNTPFATAHGCGNLLQVTSLTNTRISVKGDFSTIPKDSVVRCAVAIAGIVRNAQGTMINQGDDGETKLEVRLVRVDGDVITPSHRDLFIVATAGGSAPPPDVIKLNNLGRNVIGLAAPTITLGGCPAGLLAAPVLSGSSIGGGVEATVSIAVAPQGFGVQQCTATLILRSTTAGIPSESVPITVRLKN